MQQASGREWRPELQQSGVPLPIGPADDPLTEEQLDLILRFNDAVQQQLSTSEGGTRQHGHGAAFGGVQRGATGQLAVTGARQPVTSERQPVQNFDLGEEVPDRLLGWVSDDNNEDNGVDVSNA